MSVQSTTQKKLDLWNEHGVKGVMAGSLLTVTAGVAAAALGRFTSATKMVHRLVSVRDTVGVGTTAFTVLYALTTPSKPSETPPRSPRVF